MGDTPKTVYETAAYVVRLFLKTDEQLAGEQRLTYGVFHRGHGVMYATVQSLAHAIDVCVNLQTYLDEVTARENQPAAPAGKAN